MLKQLHLFSFQQPFIWKLGGHRHHTKTRPDPYWMWKTIEPFPALNIGLFSSKKN